VSNRIKISLGGKPYSILTDEDVNHVQELAAYADKKFLEQKRLLRSELDAAVMALLIVTDEYIHARDQYENAKKQIQSCLEDATKARIDAAELRRELTRREKELAALRASLAD